MKLRDILIKLYDSLVRDRKMIRKYYHSDNRQGDNNRNIFMVDGRIPHGGMFDRLKGAVSVYAISKCLNKDFKIYFTYPFDLRKYLDANSYDWQIAPEDVCYSYPAARPVIAYGEINDPSRLWKDRKGETHFYYGYNSLDKINAHFGTHYDWGELYRELFKPTPYLQQHLDIYQKEIGSGYIVVHLRFMNLLGDKMETDINPELDAEGKGRLMASCFGRLKELYDDAAKEGKRVMLCSDSMNFISYAKESLPDIYVVPGTVKHIDTAGETNDDENMKVFIDYYMIAGAEKVYNIVGPGMWKSAFSEYPAKIGGAGFERIYVD